MRITHLGHACLLVEFAGTRLLIDPGTHSQGFEALRALDAVLVTHQHPDHLDVERWPAVVDASPHARFVIEPETVAAAELPTEWSLAAGSEATAGAVTVRAVGGQHAPNHDQVPPLGNVGYLLSAPGEPTLYHPGDSYAEAPSDVAVLAFPLNAPWARMSQTLAFLRAVSPGVAVPIHDGLLSPSGRAAYLMHVERFGPVGTQVRDLSDGVAADV